MGLEALEDFDYHYFLDLYANYPRYIQSHFENAVPTSIASCIWAVCNDIDTIYWRERKANTRTWRYQAAMELMRCCKTALLNGLNRNELNYHHVDGGLVVLEHEDISFALERADKGLVQILVETHRRAPEHFNLEVILGDFNQEYQKLHQRFAVRDYYGRTQEFLIYRETRAAQDAEQR